ncbi:pinensin family lanthipeptide [Pedobacter sp. NJ-S-72]
MANEKLKLSELKIQSFITSVENGGQEKGQGTWVADMRCTQGNNTSITAECCQNTYNAYECGTDSTCDTVHCATQIQSCTNDGTATCTPGLNGC